jgi:hypothetical protein
LAGLVIDVGLVIDMALVIDVGMSSLPEVSGLNRPRLGRQPAMLDSH